MYTNVLYYGIDWMLIWNAVLALSTAVMALAIIITAIFAVVQLGHIKRARYSDLLIRLQLSWDSEEYIKPRRMLNTVCTNYKGLTTQQVSHNITKWIIELDKQSDVGFYEIAKLANWFEVLGYLTCEGHLERKHTLKVFSGAINRYWELLSGLVEYQRNEATPARKDAWEYFEYLALGCPQKNRCIQLLKMPISLVKN